MGGVSIVQTVLLLFLMSFITPAFSAEKPLEIRKQPEIQQVKPKKPVKVKLKRLVDGKYTWDISGDSADEVVRADRRLRKLLHVQ